MLAPRPQIDEKCMENQKFFGWALSNPKFTHYLIIKYETYSSKMCRILEIILSLFFWKLGVWMGWEAPPPLPMRKGVNEILNLTQLNMNINSWKHTYNACLCYTFPNYTWKSQELPEWHNLMSKALRLGWLSRWRILSRAGHAKAMPWKLHPKQWPL